MGRPRNYRKHKIEDEIEQIMEICKEKLDP